MGILTRVFYAPVLAQPGISLGLSALSLLLLVLVLLSVPGPIKGLYWFSIDGTDGPLSAGVTGWCMTDTSNCTYAPLSDNSYLGTLIDTGEALTVRIMLPLACYWSILTLVAWVGLTVTTPLGYKIVDLDSISRHLRFAVVEACVLCISLFGNVLCWMAFGFGRTAFMTVHNGGGKPKSGHAMETTAVAAMISLFALFTAGWGLHLRLRQAQEQWKEEAVMVRRRSMAIASGQAVGSTSALGSEIGTVHRGSMVKDPEYGLQVAESKENLSNEKMAMDNGVPLRSDVRRVSILPPQPAQYQP